MQSKASRKRRSGKKSPTCMLIHIKRVFQTKKKNSGMTAKPRDSL